MVRLKDPKCSVCFARFLLIGGSSATDLSPLLASFLLSLGFENTLHNLLFLNQESTDNPKKRKNTELGKYVNGGNIKATCRG